MTKKSKKAKDAPAALVLSEEADKELTHEDARWYHVGVLKPRTGRTRPGRRFICFEDHERDEVEEFLEGAAVGQVLVGPLGGQEYQQFVEQETSRYDKLRRKNGGTLPTEVMAKILRRAWAHHVLLDWKGIRLSGDEEPRSYTPDIGERVAKKSGSFRDEITATAAELAEECRTRDEEDGEELGNDSGGSSGGVPKPTSSDDQDET